jgi:alpha-methylacyl-CoA racemase
VVAPDGVPQAAPAPRFSRTRATLPGPPLEPEDVEGVLADWAR